jgi:hypothetical protein
MGNKGEGPADAAWEKYKVSGNAYGDEVRLVFMNGWNAALDWIPVRIAQFREIQAGLRKEIEDLKKQLESKA